MKIIANSILRRLTFVLGCLSFVLGFIGIFLPVLPTTPFMLLTAWCFLRSSPQAHAWLYRQKHIGDALRDWDESKSISRRVKVTAISMILVSLAIMWMKVRILWLKIGVTLLLVAVSLFLITRPEPSPQPSRVLK